jgi:uncharacterized RDD family membrane protein YckC
MENTDDIKEDVLTDDIHPYFQYEHATQGQRFANFLIDNLLMRFGLGYVTGLAVAKVGALLFPEFMYKVAYDTTTLLILAYIIDIVDYIIYYTLSEKLFRGYTIGKLITKTRVIRTDGKEITFKDALLRSLCRLVPFEILSGFGVPWHDAWTNTMVIKVRQ